GMGLASVWARGRVRELEDRYQTERGRQAELEREIVATSLRFKVLSRFTAYVAVDRSEVVNPGGVVREVGQPVEAPSGWAVGYASARVPRAPAAPAMNLMRAAPRRLAEVTDTLSLADHDEAPRLAGLPAGKARRRAADRSAAPGSAPGRAEEPRGLVQQL